MIEVLQGDCRNVLEMMPSASVHAVVTDPPYGLSFMGKKWDCDVPGVEVWRECLRVLKPGGHLLSFFGTRTYHRGVVPIEDAGFEIRDQIGWLYGSGFPKSSNQAGEWQGWGTALKPAWEPIVVARKPLDGTVPENLARHGVGALNVDGCRVPFAGEADEAESKLKNRHADFGSGPMTNQVFGKFDPTGRWPANVISRRQRRNVRSFRSLRRQSFRIRSPVLLLRQSVTFRPKRRPCRLCQEAAPVVYRYAEPRLLPIPWHREGGAEPAPYRQADGPHALSVPIGDAPGGTVLDPFAGSGSTGRGAALEGLSFIGIEREAEYVAIARRRGRSWRALHATSEKGGPARLRAPAQSRLACVGLHGRRGRVRQTRPAIFQARADQSRRLGVRLVRYRGQRIFLDELPADAKGRPLKSMSIECGIFCEERNIFA